MSILDTNAQGLIDAAVNSRVAPPPPPEPGIFKNFGTSAGNYFMRGMAEAGRGLSMAAAAVPVALQWGIDKIDPSGRINDRRLDDSYFRWHDEFFQNAVDYWTPKPQDVGAAGQVLGSVAAGTVQFLANPALAVNTAQMSTAEDLVRRGVDPGAALLAGDLAALGTVAGIRIPIAGRNLWQRLASGVAGNVGQSVVQNAAQQAVLKAANAPSDVVAQFDPLDERGRAIDALMGLAFGAAAHLGARADAPEPQLTQAQRDALMMLNASRQIEDSSVPGKPATLADLNASVDGTRRAIQALLTGNDVQPIDQIVRHDVDPVREAQRAEIAKAVDEVLPKGKPVERPEMGATEPSAGPKAPEPASVVEARRLVDEMRTSGEDVSTFLDRVKPDPAVHNLVVGMAEAADDAPRVEAMLADFARTTEARPTTPGADVAADVVEASRSGKSVTAEAAPPQFDESVRVPTGEFDPKTGEPVTVSANDYVAQAHAEAVAAKSFGRNLFMTAANCLLGAI